MRDTAPVAATPISNDLTEAVWDQPAAQTVAPASSTTPMPDGITPEIVAAIDTAVTAIVGKKARILSVKMLPESQVDSSSWAGQGRDIIQTSHNLVQRGH